jgi:hypothetical protein
MVVGCGLVQAVDLFFAWHRMQPIALRTRVRVSYHPLKATDHGHMNILLFTHLLRKTPVIDSIKVKGQGSDGSELRRPGPFAQLAS